MLDAAWATSGEIPEPGNPPGRPDRDKPGIVAALLRTETNCTGCNEGCNQAAQNA
ncbi:hypothetical protein GCM10027288_20450 [Bordetella tumbae]